MNDTFDLLARGTNVVETIPLNKWHRQDIATLEQAGYQVNDCGLYIEVNVFAFTALGRDPEFKVIATGKDSNYNCRAYPRNSDGFGGWDISLYGRKAEQMDQAGCPGWKDNRNGHARRVYPGHKLIANLSNESEAEINEKAIAGLAHRDNVFGRASQLVRVIYGAKRPLFSFTDEANPIIEIIPKAVLSQEIDGGCTFVKYNATQKKDVKVPVPDRVLDAVYNYGNLPAFIRPIVLVTRTPRFLPDGSLLTEPGYHSQSGIFYHPEKHFRLGEMMDVAEAKATLAAIIKDFPWKQEIHKSAFFSGVLSILGRPAYKGCTPLHLADANQAGSGKGLAWDVASIIALGYSLPRMTMTDQSEMKKAITACVFAGDPAFLLDNLTGTLKSEHLDALLTSEKWKDRVLGVSKVREMDWHGVIFATGNNLRVPRDTFRRIVYARLQSPLANPENRNDMQIKRLLAHVKQNRATLTTAALSILWQWHRAKRPRQNIAEWGSYEQWSDVIRQCMTWAELGDPLDTRETLRDADFETNLLSQLIEAWDELQTAHPSEQGIMAGFAIDKADELPKLRELLDELPGRDRRIELGKLLAKYRDRVCNGKCLVRSDGARPRWKVQSA